MAITLAVLSALCFGSGLIASRMGLRTLDARAGAAISIPTATVLFLAAAPFAFDPAGLRWDAVLVFAGLGVFFPVLVTVLTFRSNARLGTTVTGAISGTAPLFAILAAGLLLGERIPPQAAAAAIGVVAGVVLLTWRPGAARRLSAGTDLAWPVAGSVLKGVAQVGAKAGLLLWPSPFAAALIGYLVSTLAVLAARRLAPGARHRATPASRGWFMATGVCNGGAVLLMYAALDLAPVSTVAPIVAAYPLVTFLAGAVLLKEEKPTARMLAGAFVTVAAIVWLVASGAR